MPSAAKLVEIFHEREPSWQKSIRVQLPTRLCIRGEMRNVLYSSDKWERPGDKYDYIHKHESGVMLYEACTHNCADAVSVRWPSEFACLGDLKGVQFKENGKNVEARIPKGTLLLSTPDASKLVCLHPTRGFYGAIWGGRMYVGADGIDG